MRTFSFKSSLFLIIIILLSAVLIFGMIILNKNITNIGLLELNGFLNETNREELEIDYIGITSKFMLHMEFYKNNINQKEFDKKTLRVAMIISSYNDTVSIFNPRKHKFSNILLFFINILRELINQSPISSDILNPVDSELTLAYYYERNNYYDKALDVYNEILKEPDLDNKKNPIIMIHKGFCLALLQKTDKAKNILKDVIKQYNNEGVALTAATLLQYIQLFETEINKTKTSSESALDKSEKLYKLIAYNDAIEILDQMSIEDEEQKDKILYLKARCHEETGEKEEALDIYQEIIEENEDSEFAKLANNRLLIIGTMDAEHEDLKDVAKENNNVIQDSDFPEILEESDEYEEVSGKTEEEILAKIKSDEKTDNTKEPDADDFISDSNTDNEGETPEPTATLLQETPIPTTPVQKTPEPTAVHQKKTPNPTATPVQKTPEPAATSVQRTPNPTTTPVQKTPNPTTTPVQKTPNPPATPVSTDPPAETAIPVQSPPPNLEEEKKVNEDGTYKITFTSEEGIPYKIEYFDDSDTLEYYIEYLYDYNGKIIGVVKKDKDGNIIN